MTTAFERVKAAWETSDRRKELNHVVEAMAAEGVGRQELEDALEALLLELRAAGADDDTEEIVNGVWDRLTGWCHKSYHIQADVALPTKEEIERLPRWAWVAFAARCARRVLPVFTKKWSDAPIDYVRRMNWAVKVGELSAEHAGAGDDWAPPAGALACAGYVCDAVINADRDRTRAAEVINAMQRAVAAFKDKPENVLDPHIDELLGIIAINAALGVADGIATNEETHNAAKRFANAVIRQDFDQLAQAAQKQHWTDDTPVPLAVFGPMWSDGLPSNWPKEVPTSMAQIMRAELTVRRIAELSVA